MNLEDYNKINVTGLKIEGVAIVEATVENVYALNSLQAEYRAEKHLCDVAEDAGQVVSIERWEVIQVGDGQSKPWTVKFF